MYYLQSRYYNPEWGRFINADGLVGTSGELLSYNIFAYCQSNPINEFDPDGFRQECIALGDMIYGGGGIGDLLLLGIYYIEANGDKIGDIVDAATQAQDNLLRAAEVLHDKGGNSSNSGSSNNNNKEPNKSDYKKYEAKHMEKEYGLKKGEFHQLKKDILVEVRKKFPKEMKRVGDNPDIHLNSDGLMKIVSRTSNYSFDTFWDIKSFLPQ